MNKSSKLILVGAGPGAADLITIRGAKAIAEADVILYDALVDEKLLEYASDEAEKIYVGKRAGNHYASQDEINGLIASYAYQGKVILRLKGGDPGIFGRMAEEIDVAHKYNMALEVVPGVSSVIGIPTILQMPLTQRGVSESVWITTGTNARCELSEDINIAAQSTATVIIVMGMSRLQDIIAIFTIYRGVSHPIAIIYKGTTDEEIVLKGTLGNIMALYKEAKLSSPSLIIIGIQDNK